MASEASVFIDEVEVTHVALKGSSTRRLNRPSEAQVRLPMSEAIGDVGSLLKIYFDGVLHFHGRVLLCETTAETDTGYTVYNATDPLELWAHRPVRDPTVSRTGAAGNFSFPSILSDYVFGPQIVTAMMDGSEGFPFGTAFPPSDAEGPLFLERGLFDVGTVDLSGAPVDWPMTMSQLASLLTSTGEVDIVITPIELTASVFECGDPPETVYNYGQIDIYNGDYGFDLTTSVAFQYGTGLRNIQSLRWNRDMTNMCNKLWYYLGPAKDEFHQHWAANITGDDGGLAYPPGGALSPPASATNNQVGVRDFLSRCQYGVRMDIKIYDDRGDTASIGRELYRRLWQIEQWLRAQPQTLVHITPTRDTEIGSFDIGDLVLVEAAAAVRGGFSGAQRIYEYTLSWDQDSVVTCSELQTSADNSGF